MFNRINIRKPGLNNIRQRPPQSLKGIALISMRAATPHCPLVDSGVVELHEEDVRRSRTDVAIQGGAPCLAGHPGVSGGIHL